MSDRWDWLRDELRMSKAATEEPPHNVSDEDVRYLLADRDALAERCEKLRYALAMHTRWCDGPDVACDLCGGAWKTDAPECHAEGCLAAPKDAP